MVEQSLQCVGRYELGFQGHTVRFHPKLSELWVNSGVSDHAELFEFLPDAQNANRALWTKELALPYSELLFSECRGMIGVSRTLRGISIRLLESSKVIVELDDQTSVDYGFPLYGTPILLPNEMVAIPHGMGPEDTIFIDLNAETISERIFPFRIERIFCSPSSDLYCYVYPGDGVCTIGFFRCEQGRFTWYQELFYITFELDALSFSSDGSRIITVLSDPNNSKRIAIFSLPNLCLESYFCIYRSQPEDSQANYDWGTVYLDSNPYLFFTESMVVLDKVIVVANPLGSLDQRSSFNGEKIRQLSLDEPPIISMDYRDDLGLLATLSITGIVKLWQLYPVSTEPSKVDDQVIQTFMNRLTVIPDQPTNWGDYQSCWILPAKSWDPLGSVQKG